MNTQDAAVERELLREGIAVETGDGIGLRIRFLESNTWTPEQRESFMDGMREVLPPIVNAIRVRAGLDPAPAAVWAGQA